MPKESKGLLAICDRLGIEPPKPKAEPKFVLNANKFLVAKKGLKRHGIKKYIKPENAEVVLKHLPRPGEHTHCLLRGDFILGDMIPPILRGHHCPHLRVATLGLSPHNADSLAKLIETKNADQLTILCSHYFREVNKDAVYKEVIQRLASLAKFVVARSHVKLILAPTEKDWWVIEGSANLRSSDNLEQMTIFNSKELHDWHAAWFDEIAARPTHD